MNKDQNNILLDADKINVPANCDLTVFESITSTNDYLKSLPGNRRFQFCLAEEQTAGKGRLNREWASPAGKNIYLSCSYPFEKNLSELAGLSLVVGLAILHALKCLGVEQGLRVKWPNDIIHANKKLSGILIDTQIAATGLCHAIIGIGLNVNMQQEDAEYITQPWTSMQIIKQTYFDRNVVATTLIEQLLIYLDRFSREGFAVFMDEWQQVDGLINQIISVKNTHTTAVGKVLGINTQGQLLLQLENGDVHVVSSGDATIIKQ